MNNNPKISIVTVCYNAASEIERTIKSVINQTYPNIEYVIIDGGSKDGTIDIIKKYADKITYWISEPDKGIYDAMNKGIIAATGDWINFLNAGDWYCDRQVLSDVISHIPSNQSVDILYGSIYNVFETYHYRLDPFEIDKMGKFMAVLHPASFIRASYHKSHLFDISYKSSGDYHFFYNAYYTHKASFSRIPVVTTYFDATKGVSKDNRSLARYENFRLQNRKAIELPIYKLYWGFLDIKRLLKNVFISPQMQKNRLQKQGIKVMPNSIIIPIQ